MRKVKKVIELLKERYFLLQIDLVNCNILGVVLIMVVLCRSVLILFQ